MVELATVRPTILFNPSTACFPARYPLAGILGQVGGFNAYNHTLAHASGGRRLVGGWSGSLADFNASFIVYWLSFISPVQVLRV